MKLIIATDDGTPLGAIDFNTVQVIRCLKRNRGAQQVDPDGVPVPWPAIGPAQIAGYVASIVMPTGESWKAQMAKEDAAIRLAEIERTPDDTAGAIERANARIAELNDPNK